MRFRISILAAIAMLLSVGLLDSTRLVAAQTAAGKDSEQVESKKDKVARPLKVLMVTGGCCHDYPKQKDILAAGLAKRARVQIEIIHIDSKRRDIKAEVYSKPNWWKEYDAVIHNECFGAVKDVAFVEGIAKVHAAGVGCVILHCSVHSYRVAKTDEWRKCVGATSFSHEKHRPVTVKNLKTKHPIMIGFPDQWKTPNAELYKIDKLWPNATALGNAYGADTKKDHPVIWVNTYGKGKTFATSLGHHNETMTHETYLDLVSRGLLWTCNQLGTDGKPTKAYQVTQDNVSPTPVLVRFIGKRKFIIAPITSPTLVAHQKQCNCKTPAFGLHTVKQHTLFSQPTFQQRQDSPDLK